MTPRSPDPSFVEAVARRVVELLRDEALVSQTPSTEELIDASEVARRFGVTPAWARRNSDRLGAIRLGDGPRARLRFDPGVVAAALSSRPGGERSGQLEVGSVTGPRPLRRRRRAGPMPLPHHKIDSLPESGPAVREHPGPGIRR